MKPGLTIDAYIAAAAPSVQPILRRIRSTIRQAAPEAEELISYRMPAFRQKGMLIYFAAFRRHIGIYPPLKGAPALQKALARYAGPKGNLRLPLDRPIPYPLLARFVKTRLRQNLARAKAGR